MEKIKQQLKKRQLNRKRFFVILAILVLASCFRAFLVSPVEKTQMSQGNVMPDELWQHSIIEEEGKTYNEYVGVIPDNIAGDVVLGVKGYQASIKVFLNQEEIYQYQDEHREKGAGWKWVDLPDDINGQRLLIQAQGYIDTYDMPSEKNIYLGRKDAVFLKVLQENLYALIGGGILAIIGIGVLLCGYTLREKIADSTCSGIQYLGIFVLLAGIWVITDSCFMQLVAGRIALVTLISFLSFLSMPYFFLKMYSAMTLHEKKSVRVLQKLYIVNLFVNVVLYLFGLFPLYRMLIFLHILIAVTIVIVLKNTISEVRKFERPGMKVLASGMICLSLFGVVALVFAYMYWNWLYAIVAALGVLGLAACFGVLAFIRLHDYLFSSATLEEYEKKAYTDSMTGMKNRTAFLEYKEKGIWRGQKTCVVMDINNLKTVNDNFGHSEGDKLIADAAECIVEVVGTMGSCYRIGGDEFAVILPTRRAEDVEQLLLQLDNKLASKNAERDIPIDIACGYSVQKEKAASFDDWFDKADYNMYLHKRQMKAEKKANLK